MECLVSPAQRGCGGRSSPRSAASVGRNLQPGRCATRWRAIDYAAAQCGSRQDCLLGAVGECNRADHDNAGGLFRQTIYYPYSWALQYARGRVLNVLIESPTYDVTQMDAVGYIDAAATVNPEDGRTTLFILNRDLSKSRQVEVMWEDTPKTRVAVSQVLTGNDLKAVNGFDAERVKPQPFERPTTINSRTRFEVPARSYTVIQWE